MLGRGRRLRRRGQVQRHDGLGRGAWPAQLLLLLLLLLKQLLLLLLLLLLPHWSVVLGSGVLFFQAVACNGAEERAKGQSSFKWTWSRGSGDVTVSFWREKRCTVHNRGCHIEDG